MKECRHKQRCALKLLWPYSTMRELVGAERAGCSPDPQLTEAAAGCAARRGCGMEMRRRRGEGGGQRLCGVETGRGRVCGRSGIYMIFLSNLDRPIARSTVPSGWVMVGRIVAAAEWCVRPVCRASKIKANIFFRNYT
jgi:hypothetical protein